MKDQAADADHQLVLRHRDPDFWQEHPPPEAVPKEDRPTNLTPEIRPAMPWRVRDARALADYRLSVTFIDGLSGIVDMSALIASPEAGVFARLRDRDLFAQIRVEHGAVTWPGELDLAPDAMYAAIKECGEWKLT